MTLCAHGLELLIGCSCIQVELYQGARGATQLALEILLGFLVALVVLRQLSLMVQAHIHEHSFLAYYTGAFDILDLLSTLLMVATLTMWWIFAFKATRRFGMSSRFDVYRDLRAEAFITQLSDGGVELMRAAEQMERLDELAMLLSWYFALNGVNILVMIARVLHLMHFHPRLGVVTRSLVVALPDLLNFLLVGGVVFVGYAMMAHLIFGATVERFASLSDSIITCLEIIMGDMSVNDDLRALPGLMVRTTSCASACSKLSPGCGGCKLTARASSVRRKMVRNRGPDVQVSTQPCSCTNLTLLPPAELRRTARVLVIRAYRLLGVAKFSAGDYCGLIL